MPRACPVFILRALLASTGFLAGAFGHVLRAETLVIRLGHGLDATHPVHRAMLYFSERLAERSDGTLQVRVYGGGQLGSERECMELLQIGGLGMSKTSAAVLEGFAPVFRVFGLPYLFRDEAHKRAVLDGPVGRSLLEAPTRAFMRGLCYYDAGNRSFYTRKPVRTPADLAGLRIRVQESPAAIALVRAFGASATPITWGELYTALQQGIVDGAENNPPSFHLSRHYEVCRYFTLNEHTTIPDVLLVSENLWQSLTRQQRTWLREAADESSVYERRLWSEATDRALAEVERAGVEIIRPDRTAFAAAVAPLHDAARADPVIGPVYRQIGEVRP